MVHLQIGNYMKITKFISVDWGTSNLRIRLVDFSNLEILSEYESTDGIKFVYQDFLQQQEVSQKDFFIEHLVKLLANHFSKANIYPVIISGMASSSIGIIDLPYANMPIVSGEQFYVESFTSRDYHFLITSGFKSDFGVMRGEETQALGLISQLASEKKGMLLLPGTHSKHLLFENNSFSSFSSFMTGELFQMLSQHSILKTNIQSTPWTIQREQFFLKGVSKGFHENALANLFSVRVKHLLNKIEKEDNFYFLSGLLIGDELSNISTTVDHLFLAAPDTLKELYGKAITSCFPDKKCTSFNETKLVSAFLKGQQLVLQKNYS